MEGCRRSRGKGRVVRETDGRAASVAAGSPVRVGSRDIDRDWTPTALVWPRARKSNVRERKNHPKKEIEGASEMHGSCLKSANGLAASGSCEHSYCGLRCGALAATAALGSGSGGVEGLCSPGCLCVFVQSIKLEA